MLLIVLIAGCQNIMYHNQKSNIAIILSKNKNENSKHEFEVTEYVTTGLPTSSNKHANFTKSRNITPDHNDGALIVSKK